MQKFIPLVLVSFCTGVLAVPTVIASDTAYNSSIKTQQRLKEVLAADHRSTANRQRDVYRHPLETLTFFGLNETQTVVEIFPGSGWYTEILAPFLKPHGKLYEASYAEQGDNSTPYQQKATADFKAHLAARPDLFSAVTVTTLQAPAVTDIAPAGSADLVLTFRNVHNWLKDETAPIVFAALFRALKPGGILGLEEHRAEPGTPLEQSIKTGYVTEAEVIRLATNAGFKLVAKSEINANPKDTKNHPEGVWSLPPGLRASTTATGGTDTSYRATALTIGESDRMTLKFIKPQ